MSKTETEARQFVLQIISNQPELMLILRQIRSMHLSQGVLAAGAIRNSVWQVLHGQPVSLGTDIDVVFFDPKRPYNDNLAIQNQLQKQCPQYHWEVKNEVYMYAYDTADAQPFADTYDAIAHFVETPTCVGAYLDDHDVLHLIAPYGVSDLVSLQCRLIPIFSAQTYGDIYHDRIAKKQWASRWPLLHIIEPES